MANMRESNKFHEETFKVRNIICERELKHLRYIEYEDMKELIGIFHEVNQPSKKSIGEIKIDVDCSEALKGLKAVTREAKKATAALKELEEQHAKMNVQVQIDCGSKGIAKELFEQMQRARARGASI